MIRAILCSSSGGQNCISTASGIVTLCERPCSAPAESGLLLFTDCSRVPHTNLPISIPLISNRPELHLSVQTVYTVSTGFQRSEWQCVSFNRWRMLKFRKRCLYPTVQFVVANDRWCFVRSPVVLHTARNLKAWRRNFSQVQSRILFLLTPYRYFIFYLP
jgi:hypothetical protein